MAGIEKMCEVIGESCGYKMYTWKLNSIQVHPKQRKLFKGKNSILFIFEVENLIEFLGTGKFSSWLSLKDLQDKEQYVKHNGSYYTWRSDWKRPGWEIQDRKVRIVKEYDFMLYVPAILGEVNGQYYNQTYDLATTKRKLRRIMGYEPVVIKVPMTLREFYNTYQSHEERTEYYQTMYKRIFS